MKKLMLLFIFGFLLTGCNQKSDAEKIKNLNGYWEIKRAERPEGMIKEYPMSAYVDYFEIEDMQGFRMKVKPKLTGGFYITGDKELFNVKIENDSINLYYSTPYDSWKETLISSEENEIKMLNPHGIIYTYKRFTPYLSDGEEK